MKLIIVFIIFVPSTLTTLNRNQNLWMENDVVYDEEPLLLDKRLARKGDMWPEGIVPYTIGPGLESIQEFITKAAQEFANKTCIRFIPKEPYHEHYVGFIRNDSECGLATVCKAGGVQNVWIGEDCMDYDTVVHEMAHAICMDHEHERPDRDKHITLKCNQYGKEDVGYSTLNIMYDYKSVMHYQHCESDCMEPKLSGVTDCGGTELSVLDAEKINSFYKCGGCHGYRFRPRNWPSEVFVAGVDFDGEELAVCRGYVDGDITLGKQRQLADGPVCEIAHGGSHHIVSKSFEVMTKVNKKLFGWHHMKTGQAVPSGAIPGGRNKDGEPLYIGRCNPKHGGKKTLIPGKIEHGRMYYAHRGKQYECKKFQVLQCLRGSHKI